MTLYDYRCTECSVVDSESFPMGEAPPEIPCETCDSPRKRVYGNARFVFDGGRERFHDSGSLGEQRKKAREQMQGFVKKMQAQGGHYTEDMFELSNPVGKSGVPSSW